MQRVLAAAAQNPSLIPESFMGYLIDWLQINKLNIPLTQVLGYQKFLSTQVSAVYDTTDAAETSPSLVYADLTTAGPLLTGLTAGSYLILFGAYVRNDTASQASLMSVSLNGGAASDGNLAAATNGVSVGDNISVSRAITAQLSSASSSIKGKYRTTGGTGTWQHRWLVALRYGN